MRIILCGFMGCGKTTVGKELARRTGWPFVDLDQYIEKKAGMKISQIFEQQGERGFRDLEHAACREFAAGEENVIIATGGGAMTFSRNAALFRGRGNLVLFLDLPFDVCAKRVGSAKKRPLFQDREKARKLYRSRYPKYLEAAHMKVDANGNSKAVADRICILLDL